MTTDASSGAPERRAGGAGEADLNLRRHLASRLRPAAVLIGVLIAIGFPAIFALLEYEALQDSARVHSTDLARQIQQFQLETPGLWQYQAQKFMQILEAFLPDKAIISVGVTDASGHPVGAYTYDDAAVSSWWGRLTPAGRTAIQFNNHLIGYAVVRVSPATVISDTLLVLLLSTAGGVALGVFVYFFPVSVVCRMEGRLREAFVREARLHDEVQSRLAQVQHLAELTHVVVSSLDLQHVLDSVTRSTLELVQADLVRLWLADEDVRLLRLMATASRAEQDMTSEGITAFPFGGGVVGAVLERATMHYAADVLEEPLFVNKDWARAHGYVSQLAVPLLSGGRARGVLAILTRARREFSEEERSLLEVFAGKAATAVENSRLYVALEKRLVRLRTLTHLNRLVSSSLDRSEVLHEINRAAAQLTGAPMASFWLADAAGEFLDAVAVSDPELAADFPAKRLRFGEGAVGRVAVQRRSVNVPDVFADGRLVGLDWWRAHGLSSFYAIPVIVEEKLVGVLALNGRRPFRLDADDKDLLESFVSQISVAIRNADLYEESLQQGRRLATLVEITRRLTHGLDLAAVLGSIAENAAMLFQGEAGVRLLQGEFLVRIGATEGALKAMVRERLRLGESLSGRVALSGQPIISADVTIDARVLTDHPDSARGVQDQQSRTGALMCLPIRLGDRILGTLHIYRERGYRFDEETLRFATSFADQAAIAIENARLYGETQEALAELRAKNAELDSFVYSVSHDLKAPLVAVQGMAGALLEDCTDQLDDHGRHYLSRLQANVEQMERLIQDLLTLSRIGREGRGAGPVDLAEVVDDVLAELAEPIRTRGIKVTVGELPELWGLRVQLEQVMRNLLGNAVKYIGDAATPMIEVGASRRPDAWECWVRDNGIGIDPAYHEKVFEIFQRLSEVEVPGTGVGLAIVKKIVEGGGGRVWVESANGQGVTFRFTWPARTREERA